MNNNLYDETFEDYYTTVISNISENILTDELFSIVREPLQEVIYTYYYKNISTVIAVVTLEAVLRNFNKIIKR